MAKGRDSRRREKKKPKKEKLGIHNIGNQILYFPKSVWTEVYISAVVNRGFRVSAESDN